MKEKWIATLMITMSFLFLLAGCGDSKESGTKTSKKEFHFAMSGVYKPFNYKEKGKLSGFDVEIGQALANKMGMKAVPVTNPWETIIQGLQANKYDAIIGSMTITEERAKAVNFTDTYYRSGAQVFVTEGNTEITSAEKLKGKKIGVVKSSIYSEHAQTLTDKDKIVEYDSDITALMDLPTGRLDAVITDQMVGFRVMKEDAIKIKDIGDPLSQDDQAVAVRKEDKELLEKINAALSGIIEDGTYEKISDKWFGRNILEE